MFPIIVVAETCNDGDVRLSDGTSKDEGRVEVCKGEEWGTFCDNFWDRREAQVICRQLGYPNPCETSTISITTNLIVVILESIHVVACSSIVFCDLNSIDKRYTLKRPAQNQQPIISNP